MGTAQRPMALDPSSREGVVWLSSLARLFQVSNSHGRRRQAILKPAAEVLEDRSLLAAPTFSPASYTFGPFSENTTALFSLSNVTATDPDGGTISYLLVIGTPLFSVDPTGSILLNGPFTQASYSLMISAMDDQNETTLMPAMVGISVEDQSINRMHNIGAKNAVIVTKFICQDTIEEKLDVQSTFLVHRG